MNFSARTFSASLATLTLAGLLSLPAAAQPNAAPAAAHPHAAHQQHMQQRHAQRLERMKTLLQLQPQQQAAWQRYVQAIQPAPRAADPRSESDKRAMGTIERLDRAKQLRQTRHAAAEQRDQATRTFYASLSESQQQAFDTLQVRHKDKGPAHSKKASHRHMQPTHGQPHGHPGMHHPAPQAEAATPAP